MPNGPKRNNPICGTARRVGAAAALAGLLLAGTVSARYNEQVQGVEVGDNGQNPWNQELQSDVGIIEKLNSPLDTALTLTDEEGEPVELASFFKPGRPVVINLGYSRCPSICIQMRSQLADTLGDTGLTLGEDLVILNISIDPNETPELSRATRDQVWRQLEANKVPPSPEGWRFLTADQETITRLTDSVGYKYFYIPPQDEFGHPGVLVLADGEGVIRRYLNGKTYSARDLRMSIVETSDGKVGGLLDKAFVTCFRWDPEANNYSATARFIMMTGGGVTIIALGGLVLAGFAFERRRRQLLEQQARDTNFGATSPAH